MNLYSENKYKSSSRLHCLILKILLFLLCINIKKFTAAPLSTSSIQEFIKKNPTTLSLNERRLLLKKTIPGITLEGATTDEIKVFGSKIADVKETFYELTCPVKDLINKIKRPRSTIAVNRIKEDVFEKTQVIWYKNNELLKRENGNSVKPKEDNDSKTIVLFSIGPSDGGTYKCIVNWNSIPIEAYDYFKLYAGAQFTLEIDQPNYLPDCKPTITHHPTFHKAKRYSSHTFECRAIETLLHYTTYWYKCLFKDTYCIKTFENDYEDSIKGKNLTLMRKYVIKEYAAETLTISNITDDNTGYYGCWVQNDRGFDLRLGNLDLIEDSYTTTISPLLDKPVTDSPSDPSNNTINTNDKPHKKVTPLNDNLLAMPTNQFQKDHVNLTFLTIFSTVAIIIIIFSVYIITKCSTYKREKKFENLMSTPIVSIGHKEENIRQHLPNGDCPDIYNIGKLTTTTVPLYDHPPRKLDQANNLCEAIVQDACVINPTYGFIRSDNDYSKSGNLESFKIPRRNLERLNKIGEGQFGEVWRYIKRQKDGAESFVAVKQLKNRVGLGDRERLELIAEIEIMKSVNDHPNVIRLLNYCADDYEPILLIMEYAENGKLQTYLRNCRNVRKPYTIYGCISSDNSIYADVHSSSGCSSANSSDSGTIRQPNITSKELLKFSYHIAKGMEYVASKGIIHRDLASRNILVSRDKVCKVADFGFARRVSDDSAYERTTANPVPVKWMAPEALVENKFTSKSDVFSLGILMWEIVTLGATPYEYLNSTEVYKKVTSGGRLEKPAHCKDEFYNIMSQCWLQNPSERPTFKEIALELEKLLLSENDYIELDQYPEHAYYNILNTAEKEIVQNII